MQIRERRNSWALIRTVYDKTRKRGVAKCLGTVSKTANCLPEGLQGTLTEQEFSQFEGVFKLARAKRDMARREHYAKALPMALEFATQWYLDPRTEGSHLAPLANDTREQFSKLLAAMVKAGVGRRRNRQSKVKTRVAPRPSR